MSLAMLVHSSDIECITCVIDTLQRYSTIWACMDAMSQIVHALNDTYHRWKAQGLQSHILLATILEFDSAQYLNDEARLDIVNDMNAFAVVSLLLGCIRFLLSVS
jgi:mediator of RNA polymerase II transcription subunit 12, fungi type